MAVASSAAAASLSSHPAARRAHFTNLMKTFAVARPGLPACPIVPPSPSPSLCLSLPQQIDGLARATAVAFAFTGSWKLQPATAAAAAADSDCINNLCSPWKIIDQVCLFAVLGRRRRSVVAFNLLADRRLCGLRMTTTTTTTETAAAAAKDDKKAAAATATAPAAASASAPAVAALGVIEIILSEKSAFKKYFSKQCRA